MHDPDVDLWNGSRSDMQIESLFMTSYYLIDIAMFFLSVTISKIFTVEIGMTLTNRFEGGHVNMPIESLPFSISEDICCQYMLVLDIYLYNRSRLNVNMPIDSPYMTCYLMAV